MRQGTYAEPTGSALRSAAGPARAVDLAARHLTALGCRTTRLPNGGLALRAGRHLAECAVDWAGPVELPLTDEYDVQAACGLMHVHGRRFGGPTPLGVDFATATAGVLAALGASAALWAGARDGRPRRVSTSVAAALLAVGQYLAAATADEAEPSAHWMPGGPPFTSADGVRFELESLAAEGWQTFWTGLGVERTESGRGWGAFQQRYATASCPLPAVLDRAVGGRDFAELAGLAEQAGVDLTPVLAQPPNGAPELPWRIASTGGTAVDRSAADRSPLNRSAAGPLPLAGLVVVEVARRVQGPLAAHLLGLLGARVVRIEPPGGDPLRGVPPTAGDCSARFHALNHGKERVEADLGTAAGRAVVRELASGADVFLHSLAPGSDERFGLDAARLLCRPELRSRPRTQGPETTGPEAAAAPVCTDLALLADDPRFAGALRRDRCVLVRSPWEFG